MFTNADKQVIREISQSVAAINDRLDIHKQLVELNGQLKQLLEAQDSQKEIDAMSDRLDKQAAEFDAAKTKS